nr:ribonuclease H-like domain-containing protein [Tanacetum cinerariifolium]
MSNRHQELASPEANDFCKELASPKQTALGKDILNSLIVDSLLKTIWLSVHHGSYDEILPPPPQTPTQQAPHTVSTIKLPIMKKEGLHKGYDRFQSLLSQLEILGAGVSTQKFLRSLPASWPQVSLIMRTKPGVETLSFDDLY